MLFNLPNGNKQNPASHRHMPLSHRLRSHPNLLLLQQTHTQSRQKLSRHNKISRIQMGLYHPLPLLRIMCLATGNLHIKKRPVHLRTFLRLLLHRRHIRRHANLLLLLPIQEQRSQEKIRRRKKLKQLKKTRATGPSSNFMNGTFEISIRFVHKNQYWRRK